MTTIESTFKHLDQLADLLRTEGFASGPDVWLSVYRLLNQLKQRNSLPNDTNQLRLCLGPLFCRNPEEQARFKVIFDRWWNTYSDTLPPNDQKNRQSDAFTLSAINRVSSPGQTALNALRQKIKEINRNWIITNLTIIALVVGLAYFVLKRPTPPIVQPPQKQVILPPTQPDTPPLLAIQPKPTVSIVDEIAPRPQPEPLRLTPNEKQWLAILQGITLGFPLLIALLWIRKRYREQWLLKRQPTTGKDLFNQLRFERVLTPIWGGAQAEQAFRDLRAARIIPSNRLHIEATIEATSRQGDYVYPIYRNRRIAPEHLLLVRSMHRDDQKAALAEELEKRFRELGLHIETYRFRDDPRWLIRWKEVNQTDPQYTHLDQLAARFSNARLIVISETDIIFHPLSGEPRHWLKALTTWTDKIWLHPHDAYAPHAALLAQQQFLLLPFLRASFSQWVNYFTSARRLKPAKDQPIRPITLPHLIASEPDVWLKEKPPYGIELGQLILQLEQFLGPYGLRLLRAIAAYPKPNWKLTQALDYLLYGHLNTAQQTMDPPERREQRLMRISRLPWLTHVHFPYWLREQLFRDLDDTERERISSAWQRLFTQLTDKENSGTLKLEVRTLSQRELLVRLQEQLALSPQQAMHDAIFAQVLLGGQSDPLDFKLPDASTKSLSQANRLLILRPALSAALLAVIATTGIYMGWQQIDEANWSQFRQNVFMSKYRNWSISLHATHAAEPLAKRLSTTLQTQSWTITRADPLPPASDANAAQVAANQIHYAPEGRAMAEQIALSLRWLTYGEAIEPVEDNTLPAQTIRVTLNQTYQPLTAFNDTLRHAYVKQSDEKSTDTPSSPFEEPKMVRIPPGSFVMGSPETEPDRSADEGPQRTVTISYEFEIGQTEVTFAQYDVFASETNRPLPDDRSWGRGNQPVINVSFDDAQAYVAWLSQKTGKQYRLPTEAEWEYVARAGSTTAYWWGDRIGKNNAVCDGCGSQWDGKQTTPVGSFKPNTFGVYDTAGNVYEWTQDCWHDSYQGAPNDGSAWVQSHSGDCTRRVVRGGSWGGLPLNLRSAFRRRYLTGGADYVLGFRVARDLP